MDDNAGLAGGFEALQLGLHRILVGNLKVGEPEDALVVGHLGDGRQDIRGEGNGHSGEAVFLRVRHFSVHRSGLDLGGKGQTQKQHT